MGIKSILLIIYVLLVLVVNIHTNKMVRLLGKSENSQRFMHLALFQGKSKNLSESVVHQLGHSSISAAQNAIAPIEEDPTLFCTAWKKDRFYMFTKREPSESNGVDTFGRDIYNERPTHDDSKVSSNYSSSRSARTGIIHTTVGDIHIRFYPDEYISYFIIFNYLDALKLLKILPLMLVITIILISKFIVLYVVS